MPSKKTSGTVAQQRRVQAESLAASSTTNPSKRKAPATSIAPQPVSPFPKQQLRKPGLESDLHPPPRFEAKGYKGSGKLAGKVALITGGDSGIGRAVAVLYAREGADIAIVHLEEEQSDAEITRKHVKKEGEKCVLIAGDVIDVGFCGEAVKRTIEKLGKLDILVNNAAFQQHAMSITDLSDEHFDLTVRTNLYGYFQMARAALPHLPEGGAIINTGSVTGLYGSRNLLDYSATKGAIHAFTKALASNVLERGIRVNAVAPGPVWTPLNPADRTAEDIACFGADTGMKRPAQPEEIAPAYVFLAAPICSSYITGIVLPIEGGGTG